MPLELKGTKKHKVLGLVATAIIPKSVYLNGKMATGLYFYYYCSHAPLFMWRFKGAIKALSRLYYDFIQALLRLY